MRTIIGIGVRGALETYELAEDGAVAAVNALGSVATGVVAVYVGIVIGRAV